MSDIFSKFQESLAKLSPAVQGSGVELLLSLVEPEMAILLRLCAIPHEFSPAILPILSPGLGAAAADERYEKLANFPFVTVGAHEATMHDQVRRELFASWLKEEKRDRFAAASLSLTQYFEELMSSALGWGRQQLERKRMFHLIGADPLKGFAEFERLCRQSRYQYRFSDCHALIRLVHEYEPILTRDLRLRLAYFEGKLAADLRQWERAEELFKQIIEDASAAPELKSKAFFRMGTTFADQGQNRTAIARYEEALPLAESHPDGDGQVYRILSALGTAYREESQFERAQKLLEKSLRLAESARDYGEMATSYNSLGTLYEKLGDADRAVGAYRRSLECLEKTGNGLQTAQVYNNLGTVYANKRDWQQAEQQYQRSLEISRAGGDTWAQAKTLNNLTRIYKVLGQPEKAVEVSQQAIDLFKELRDFTNAAIAQRNLGKYYWTTTRAELARRAFEEAKRLFLLGKDKAKADDTQMELQRLDGLVGLPWWAWVGLIITGLLVVLIIALIILER